MGPPCVGTNGQVRSRTVRDIIDVHNDTLKLWAAKGIVRATQSGGKGVTRYYHLGDICKHVGLDQHAVQSTARTTIAYARVSSSHQKQDLERQVRVLQEACPTATILRDIGSGINFRRRGLLTLLERVYQGHVERVVVAHKDRLCRFGHELLEFIFAKAHCTLVVLDRKHRPEGSVSKDSELADDLLSIVNVFVARRNGERSAAHRRERCKRNKRKRPHCEESGGSQQNTDEAQA